MRPPDFKDNNQYEAKIKHYCYKNLDAYLATPISDPKYEWHKSNLLGEMYEYTVYERLLKWALDTKEVSEFILKGPHIQRRRPVINGLRYDPNLEIYYNSGGETIAEFDALFKTGNKRYFVETTNIENRAALKKLKSGIIRKRNLLRYMFPDDDIQCWVITSYSGNPDFREFHDVEVFKTPKYDLNIDSIVARCESLIPLPPIDAKFKTLYALNYRTFDYFAILRQIHAQVISAQPKIIKDTLKVAIKPYAGLIERFFLGKISGKAFLDSARTRERELSGNLIIDQAYPTLTIGEDLSFGQKIYLKTMNGKLFEIEDLKHMKAKVVPLRKRAIRDIRYLDSIIKPLTNDDLSLFWDWA